MRRQLKAAGIIVGIVVIAAFLYFTVLGGS